MNNALRIALIVSLGLIGSAAFAKTKGLVKIASTPQGEVAVGTPVNMHIDAYDFVTYTFTTGAAGVYKISLDGATTDLGWRLLDADDNDVAECDLYDDATPESCDTADLTANSQYRLTIDEYSDAPTDYTLTIAPK